MTREERWQQIGGSEEERHVYGGRASLGLLAAQLLGVAVLLVWASAQSHVVGGMWPLYVAAGLAVPGILFIHAFKRACRAVLQADGVEVGRLLQLTVFVPWKDVSGVVSDRRGTRLHVENGSPVPVMLWPRREQELRTVIEHIAERAGLEEITGRPELIRRFMPEARWPVQAAWWRAVETEPPEEGQSGG